MYFSVCLMFDTWFLSRELLNYQKQMNLWDGGIQLTGVAGAILVIAAAIGIYFNQFIVKRLQERLTGKQQIPSDDPVKNIGA